MKNNASPLNPQTNGTPSQVSRSLEEAAAFLEVRADDLAATLPTAGIDLSKREKGRLTGDDMERLKHLVQGVKQSASESVYGGGNF